MSTDAVVIMSRGALGNKQTGRRRKSLNAGLRERQFSQGDLGLARQTALYSVMRTSSSTAEQHRTTVNRLKISEQEIVSLTVDKLAKREKTQRH